MSFTINTNLAAMNALFNVNNTDNSLQTAIQRLSTGEQINSAADNPSGLIISQQYTAEIGGLTQAVQNSQDGVNYAKTADGALAEVSTLLDTARSLAVASANTGTLSTSALQANQAQLESIAASITQISQQTQFGTKYLLNGSSGVTSTVTNAADVSTIDIGGTFNGSAVTASSGVTLTVTQAATQAALVSKSYAFATTTAGSNDTINLNGVNLSINASDSASTIVGNINGIEAQTGVHATYDSTNGKIDLATDTFGSAAHIDLTDASGVFASSAGYSTASGTDAVAQVAVGGHTVLFTGGLNGNSGLTLTDADGNTMLLTTAGNSTATADATVGQVTAGSAQFQIGAFSGQTADLSIGNMAASQLGTGVASGVNLSNLNLTTAAGASQAIQVIDAAINQVATTRGNIGNFEANVLQANVQSLGVAQQNLSSANASIVDTNVAAETTTYTQLQILEQAGISVLAQANQLPQAVLKLLGG